MTDNQINAAIAQACGWKHPLHPDAMAQKQDWSMPEAWWLDPKGKMQLKSSIPNYCNDLNAMHEAEKSIPDELWNCYFNQLARITKAEQSDDRVFFCASARHRAEAFLRTLGKWEEPVVKECFTTEADLLRDAAKMVGEVQP